MSNPCSSTDNETESLSPTRTQNGTFQENSETYSNNKIPSTTDVALGEDVPITNGIDDGIHIFQRHEVQMWEAVCCEDCNQLAEDVVYVCSACGKRRCLDCDVAVRRARGWRR